MAWAAIAALARVELRRSWRTLVVLGLLAGLAGGVVLGALAMARRTATAPGRLQAAVHLDDARVVVFGNRSIGRRIAALPMVQESWIADSTVAQIEGEAVAYASISSGPRPPAGLFTPVVVHGRAPVAADEVMVEEGIASSYRLKVGSLLRLHMLTPDQVAQFDTGFGDPAGPRLRVHVTGIMRMPSVGQGVGSVIGSSQFSRDYGKYSVGPTVLLRLKHGQASAAALSRAIDELSKQAVLPADAEEFGPLAPVFPRQSADPKVRTAQRVLVAGLMVFVLVALIAGLLATAQSLSRHHAAGAGEQRIEAALGLTSLERVLARAMPACLGAAVAAVVAAASALATAGLEPMGGLRRFEPHPGWVPNVAIIGVGALAIAAAFVLVAAVTTWRAAQAESGRRRAGTLPGTVAGRLRNPWLLAGTTFAVSRGRGRSAVPVRATALGAVLGIAGVVGAATFSAGLHRLATTPARYGWNADFSVSDAKSIDVPSVAGDPRVTDLDWVSQSTVRTGSSYVAAYAQTSLKGTLRWTTLQGRLPRATDEVAVGPVTLEQLGATVGDRITVQDASGAPHRLRVVGTVLTPTDASRPLGDAMMLSVTGLIAVQQSPPITSMLIRTVPGTGESLRRVLARRFEIVTAQQPSEVRNVTDLGRLPDALALFLSLVAAGALAHGLVLTSRRRAHDIAVLRSLGFTPRQVAAAVLTMAGVTATVGLVVGVPVGLATGRVVWHQVAQATHVATDVALPHVLLSVLVPVVLLAAALLAVLPARRSASVRPAGVLRVE